MASLRRIASLDKSEPCPSLNPGRLIRHSSLPNLFLGQPELSVKADGLRPRNHDCKRGLPHSISFSTSRTLSHSPKLSLCRALSTNSYDELSCFEIPTADVRGRFSLHPNVLVAFDSRGSENPPARMEAQLTAAGKVKSIVDAEKSIVYNELKKSLWKFEAPPRSLSPSHVEGRAACAGINTHRHTHIDIQYEASTHQQDVPMDCTRSDVKGRPLSLRMLKRKSSKAITPSKPSFERQLNQNYPPQGTKVFTDASDSVSSAFTSLFYIMEMLQQYTQSLRMRSRPPIFETDYRSSHENLDVGRACTEMLESFLWLFQQVFSCTPSLMLLTMVLLADFTLHSMSMHVVFPVMALGEPPTSAYSPSQRKWSEAADPVAHQILQTCKILIRPSITAKDQYSHVALACKGVRVPGHVDDKTRHRGMNSEDLCMRQSKEVVESRGRQKPLSEFLSGHEKVDLDGPTKRMLVAPVQAPILEADDYPCFDQTDLAYQREISADPTNPLLLANYAQFVHLVRHDHNRAEELYKKAVGVEVDVDGELMGKFANFLWVAKGDVAEADRAFEAATMADPSNAFHAGNYAHFLWNSGAQAEEMPTNCF